MDSMSSIHTHVTDEKALLICAGPGGKKKKVVPPSAYLKKIALAKALEQAAREELMNHQCHGNTPVEDDEPEDESPEDNDVDSADDDSKDCPQCGQYVCRCGSDDSNCPECGFSSCQCSSLDNLCDDDDLGYRDGYAGPVCCTPTHATARKIDLLSNIEGWELLRGISGSRLTDWDVVDLLEQHGVDPEELKLHDCVWADYDCAERLGARWDYDSSGRFDYDYWLAHLDGLDLSCLASHDIDDEGEVPCDSIWSMMRDDEDFVFVDTKGRLNRSSDFKVLIGGKTATKVLTGAKLKEQASRQEFPKGYRAKRWFIGEKKLRLAAARKRFDAMHIKHGIEEVRHQVATKSAISVPPPRPTAEVHVIVIVRRGDKERKKIKPVGLIVTHYTPRGQVAQRELVAA